MTGTPQDVFVDVNGERFAAIDYGGTGHDILLVHQLMSNAQAWAPVASSLTRVGHVVAVDLRGHGLTRLQGSVVDHVEQDLPATVAALGLQRPVVVLEQEEVLALAPRAVAALDPVGVIIASISSVERGDDARQEWAEQVGLESLDVWHERFGLFASGTIDELEPYLNAIVERANADWMTSGVPPEQFRRYFERHIEVGPERWERLPRRDVIAEALTHIERCPHGLDLLDAYEGPLWMIDGDEAVTDKDLKTLRDYAASRPDRGFRVVPGGPMVETFDADTFAAAIGEMLAEYDR